SQGFAGPQMGLRIEIALQRQLDDRDIRRREHELQRDEHAMVEAALRVYPGRQTGGAEQLTGALRQCGMARRRIGQLIGMRREAVIIVDQLRMTVAGHRKAVIQPVGGHQYDRLGPRRQGFGDTAEKGPQNIPGIRRLPVHEETRAGTMGYEEYRHALLALVDYRMSHMFALQLTGNSMI